MTLLISMSCAFPNSSETFTLCSNPTHWIILDSRFSWLLFSTLKVWRLYLASLFNAIQFEWDLSSQLEITAIYLGYFSKLFDHLFQKWIWCSQQSPLKTQKDLFGVIIVCFLFVCLLVLFFFYTCHLSFNHLTAHLQRMMKR